jgi:hypothetical protein
VAPGPVKGSEPQRFLTEVMRRPVRRVASNHPRGREAADIAEQTRATGSAETDEGVSEAAAAETDATDVVEAAGHFRIYLGAAAGVGKTYAMLSEGRRRLDRGTDIVIGFVECHGRQRTEEMIDGWRSCPARRWTTGEAVWRKWISTRY